MPLATNIVRRGARYYFRARIPMDLIDKVGRHELSRALGTSDPKIARKKAAVLSILTHRLHALLRIAQDMSRVNYLVRQWLKAELDAYSQTSASQSPDIVQHFAEHTGMPLSDAAKVRIEQEAEASMEIWRGRYESRDWAAARHLADLVITQSLADIKPDSDEYHLLCQQMTLAMAEYHATRMERAAGNWAYDPLGVSGRFPPEYGAATGKEGSLGPSRALGELIKQYLLEKEEIDRKPIKRVMELAGTLNLFAEWVGAATKASEIDTRKVGEFRSMLLKLPPNHRKRFKGKKLDWVLAEAKAKALAPMKKATVNGHLAIISGFFDWAISVGEVSADPAAKIRVSKSTSDEAARGIFRSEHLEKIFNAPLYKGCRSERFIFEPGSTKVRNWKFWVPLIGLFTGARLGEICSLRTEDVVLKDGIWCFDLVRQLKSPASKRIVPIHPELHKIGILQLAEQQRAKGAKMLLPDIPPPLAGFASNQPSKWFITFLIKTLGSEVKEEHNLVNHGFRHTMITRLRETMAPEGNQFIIVGHKDRHTTKGYGEYPIAPLYDAIMKVKQPVDLSHLYLPQDSD